MLCGSDDIKAVCRKRIGEQGHVTPDGLFSWIEVECLGACCNAPMVQINEDYYEDLTPENFAKLLDDLAMGRPVRTGSQIGRVSSEPVGGLTALTDALRRRRAWRAECAAPLPRTISRRRPSTRRLRRLTPRRRPPTSTPPWRPCRRTPPLGKRPTLSALGRLAIEAPRGSGPDDLQRIKGVGPVNEKRLHELGVFHFDQIAAWVRSEIRWVGTYLSFPGRIDREQWVAQASKLAAGGSGPKDEQTHTHLPAGKIGN